MENYEEMEMDILEFDTDDVIMTSNTCGSGASAGGDGDGGPLQA